MRADPRSPPPEAGDQPIRAEGWPRDFARGASNRRALLVLASLPYLTARRLAELAGREGTATACLAAVRAGRSGGAGDSALAAKLDGREMEEALRACGARIAVPGSTEYPSELGDLSDPPAVLFLKGLTLDRAATRVAVVGARNCSQLGREVSRDIGRGLSAAGLWVVSGAARGIDSAAHEGALLGGGRTVAVLGCGIDVAYPPSSRVLIERIARTGTVLSEYPPGVPALPLRFPARNRIVAALSEAVVVVEGAAGSGSLITADHALDLGRTVFAVPGPVTSPLSEVPLALLRDGAGLVRGADDLLLDLGRLDPDPGVRSTDAGGEPPQGSAGPDIPQEHASILRQLAGPTLPSAAAKALGWDPGQALVVLTELEVRGLVRAVGGRYERTLAAQRLVGEEVVSGKV